MSSAEAPETHADNDRRVLRYWQEWEVADREIRSVLVVATGIELRPGHDGFDEAQLQEVIDQARAIMRDGANPIDLLRIVPDA